MTDSPSPDADQLTDPPGTDLQQLMKPLYREHDEPRDGFEPVPVWMAALFGGLLFWGGWYFASYSGDYRGDALDRRAPRAAEVAAIPDTPEKLAELGRTLFANCALCHQAEAGGLPGRYPPLKDSEWVVGEQASAGRLARIVLYGMEGEIAVKGEKFAGPMPGFGGLWKDDQIAAVLTYIRGAWGNTASAVTPAEVAAIRAMDVGRPTNGLRPVTAEELLKVPIR